VRILGNALDVVFILSTTPGVGNPVRLRNWRAAVLGNERGIKTLVKTGKSPRKAESNDSRPWVRRPARETTAPSRFKVSRPDSSQTC